MRILLGLHEFFPDYGAGTEVITLSVARELRRRGHEIRIVTGFPARIGSLRDDQRFDQYLYDGFTVDRFKHSYEKIGDQENMMEHEFHNELFGQRFSQLLQEFKPDLVHFFHLNRLSASALDACFDVNVPAFFTATDFWAICPLIQMRLPDNSLCDGPDRKAINCIRHLALLTATPRVQKVIQNTPDWAISLGLEAAEHGLVRVNPYSDQACAMSHRRKAIVSRLNRAEAIFAPSKIMARKLAENGIRADRLHHLPYGVDISGIQRSVDKGTHPRLRIGFIGTLGEHKGPHILIDAIRSLPAELAVDVTLWGPKGNVVSYIERIYSTAALDKRIHFAGPFANDALNSVLQQIDLLVVPSTWQENTPMVIYEAIGAGVPVIVTDLPGLTEAIPPGAGVAFAKEDTAGLAAIIVGMARDRARIGSMSAACRPPMSIVDHVTILEDAYTRIKPPL